MSKASKAQILDDIDDDSVDTSKGSVVDYGVEDVPPLATALFLGLQVSNCFFNNTLPRITDLYLPFRQQNNISDIFIHSINCMKFIIYFR